MNRSLCFDGDKAGVGAAYRSIDRALPLLKPGKSLAFAFLPDGQDPDDLVRAKGAGAFNKLLEEAQPLVDVLWRRELENAKLDTPERRAAFRNGLRSLVKSITDKDVRNAYGGELARRLDAQFAPQNNRRSAGAGRRSSNPWRRDQRGQGSWAPPPAASADLLRRGAPSAFGREATLILPAVNHPGLVERCEDAFLSLALADPGLDRLLAEIIGALTDNPALDSAGLKAHLSTTQAAEALERVLSDETLNRQKFLQPGAEMSDVEQGWKNALRHHLIATNSQQELRDAASQSFTDGEEIWKAAVTARDGLFNSANPGEGRQDESEASVEDLNDRLDRMRESVKARQKN